VVALVAQMRPEASVSCVAGQHRLFGLAVTRNWPARPQAPAGRHSSDPARTSCISSGAMGPVVSTRAAPADDAAILTAAAPVALSSTSTARLLLGCRTGTGMGGAKHQAEPASPGARWGLGGRRS